MNLTIPFTQTEEALLTAAAHREGVAPAELIKRLALEHLPLLSASADDELNAKLLVWQQQDGTPLMPDVSTATLYARWTDEDARMTDKERDAEDALWNGIEQKLKATGGLRLRQLGS